MSATMEPSQSAEGLPSNTAQQVHDDIEQMLGLRSAKGGGLERLEGAVKEGGSALWRAMKRHPFASMLALGAGAVVAATAIGVTELAFGTAFAIAAYKVLREGEPPIEAFEEVERELGR